MIQFVVQDVRVAPKRRHDPSLIAVTIILVLRGHPRGSGGSRLSQELARARERLRQRPGQSRCRIMDVDRGSVTQAVQRIIDVVSGTVLNSNQTMRVIVCQYDVTPIGLCHFLEQASRPILESGYIAADRRGRKAPAAIVGARGCYRVRVGYGKRLSEGAIRIVGRNLPER